MTRIGFGMDVHALTDGRKLILCGVEIPHGKGLDGHSDADVATHALMDALLGAAALGDIGAHFPPTDMQYQGISSLKLLDEVMKLLASKGYTVVNADITIAAQRPKLAPYIGEMRAVLADRMELALNCVSVKATTTEHLGFEGEEKGITAYAVCCWKAPDEKPSAFRRRTQSVFACACRLFYCGGLAGNTDNRRPMAVVDRVDCGIAGLSAARFAAAAAVDAFAGRADAGTALDAALDEPAHARGRNV